MSWKIGDKVVAISDGKFSGRKKNRIYEVLNTDTCRCGAIKLDVGFISNATHVTCCICGHIRKKTSSTYWQSSTEYRHLSEISSELSEEILESVLTTIEEPIEV